MRFYGIQVKMISAVLRHAVGRWDRVLIRAREVGVNKKGGHADLKNDVTVFRYFAALQASYLHERSLSYNTYAMSDVTSAEVAARSASVAFHIGLMDSETTFTNRLSARRAILSRPATG